MLLLHMQEIVFVDSQEGLLSSRGGGGGGPDILAPGLQDTLRPRGLNRHSHAVAIVSP